jgi:hypothetical protein
LTLCISANISFMWYVVQAVPCLLVNLPQKGVLWTADVTNEAWSVLSSSTEPSPTTSVEVLSAATGGKPMMVTVFVNRTRVLLNELACHLALWDSYVDLLFDFCQAQFGL